MIKKQLRENPGPLLNLGINYLKAKKIVSKDMLPVVQMMQAQLLANPEYMEWPIGAIEAMENFFRSESGKRMLKVRRFCH